MENTNNILLKLPKELRDSILGYNNNMNLGPEFAHEAAMILRAILENKIAVGLGISSKNLSAIATQLVILQNTEMSVSDFSRMVGDENERMRVLEYYLKKRRATLDTKGDFLQMCDDYQNEIVVKAF